jgi:hypothetical protein
MQNALVTDQVGLDGFGHAFDRLLTTTDERKIPMTPND